MMKNHKDNYMVKDDNNILINRIVATAILSIALLLGYWGFCKYKSTTNKMEAELIEIELKHEAKRKTMVLLDKAKANKQSGRYEEALGFYEEAKLLSPDLPRIDRLIKVIKKKIENERRRLSGAEKKKKEGLPIVPVTEHAKYTKGGLGITAQLVTAQLQKSFGLKDNQGALVSDIEPNSLAARAGIKSGDVIIKYKGSKIKDPFHLRSLVAAETDKGLEVTIIREGKELTLNSAILESPKTRNAKVVEDTEAEINNGMDRSIKERKVKAPLNSSSLFACRNSRIYHKSNCSKLSSDDLIEFTSFLKARDAGGIPCEYCNPSAFSGNNTFKAGSTNIYEITSQVQDSNKFDIHYRVFSSTFQKTWYSVIQVLNKQKEKGIQQKKDKGVIITDLTRHGIYGFPKYDKYYVVIAPLNSSSTKVSLKLFTYYRDMKDRKFTDIVLLPEEDKVYMNKRAKKFLNKITKSLANSY